MKPTARGQGLSVELAITIFGVMLSYWTGEFLSIPEFGLKLKRIRLWHVVCEKRSTIPISHCIPDLLRLTHHGDGVLPSRESSMGMSLSLPSADVPWLILLSSSLPIIAFPTLEPFFGGCRRTHTQSQRTTLSSMLKCMISSTHLKRSEQLQVGPLSSPFANLVHSDFVVEFSWELAGSSCSSFLESISSHM